MNDKKETAREDQGYHTTNQPKSLSSLLPKERLESEPLRQSKSGLKRIVLRMDDQVYGYIAEIADNLVRRGKAEYVD